jgi:hypothetical protein
VVGNQRHGRLTAGILLSYGHTYTGGKKNLQPKMKKAAKPTHRLSGHTCNRCRSCCSSSSKSPAVARSPSRLRALFSAFREAYLHTRTFSDAVQQVLRQTTRIFRFRIRHANVVVFPQDISAAENEAWRMVSHLCMGSIRKMQSAKRVC